MDSIVRGIMSKIKEMAAQKHDAIHIGQHYVQKNKKSSAGIEVKLAGKGQIQGQIAVKKLFFVAFQGQRVRNTDSLWKHKLLHKRIRKNKKYPYKGA